MKNKSKEDFQLNEEELAYSNTTTYEEVTVFEARLSDYLIENHHKVTIEE